MMSQRAVASIPDSDRWRLCLFLARHLSHQPTNPSPMMEVVLPQIVLLESQKSQKAPCSIDVVPVSFGCPLSSPSSLVPDHMILIQYQAPMLMQMICPSAYRFFIPSMALMQVQVHNDLTEHLFHTHITCIMFHHP
jgi:hypothetical protein